MDNYKLVDMSSVELSNNRETITVDESTRRESRNFCDVERADDKLNRFDKVNRLALDDNYDVVASTHQNEDTLCEMLRRQPDLKQRHRLLAKSLKNLLEYLIAFQNVGVKHFSLNHNNVVLDDFENILLLGVTNAVINESIGDDLSKDFGLFVFQLIRDCEQEDFPPSLEYLVHSALGGASLKQLLSQPFLHGKSFLTM